MVVATSHPVQVCKLHLVCTLIPVVSPPLETQAPTLLSMKFSLGSGLAKKKQPLSQDVAAHTPPWQPCDWTLKAERKEKHRKDTERGLREHESKRENIKGPA